MFLNSESDEIWGQSTISHHTKREKENSLLTKEFHGKLRLNMLIM